MTAGSDLGATVAAALDRLPAPMASQRSRASLLRVAQLLPCELATGPIGLEIRLAGPTVVDLFAAAVPGDPAFDALVTALAVGTGWTDPGRARDLAVALRRWRSGEGALPGVARYLLVEVDAPHDPHGPVAVPSIFLAPRGARDILRPGQPPNAFHRRVDLTVMATAELSGVWPDPATAQALAQVVAAVPEPGDVFAVGAMVSREAGASLRVAVRRLDLDGMHAVLCAAGLSRQADVITGYAGDSCAPQRDIAFEVGPGAESRVGLELSPRHDWKSAEDAGWPELLDEVVARGLARPERAAGVLGLIDATGDPLWGLAHVKVAADSDGLLPAAKLYVGLLHR